MILLSFEKKTDQLNSEFWHRCLPHNWSLLRSGQREHGLDTCKEEEVPRIDFSIAWILTQPRLFSTFEQFKAILEENRVDPAMQDSVLFPSGFAECVYHVGSSHDMHSVIQSGLIPFGKDAKKGRQTVFFTTVNPMFAHPHKQRAYDVTKPRVAVYLVKLENTSEYTLLGQFESCSEDGSDVRPNKIQRDPPCQHFASSVYFEGGGTEFRRRTEVTKPAWDERRNDTSNTDERQSGVNSSKQGETCCGWNEGDMLPKIDCRIQGLPHSTV